MSVRSHMSCVRSGPMASLAQPPSTRAHHPCHPNLHSHHRCPRRSPTVSVTLLMPSRRLPAAPVTIAAAVETVAAATAAVPVAAARRPGGRRRSRQT